MHGCSCWRELMLREHFAPSEDKISCNWSMIDEVRTSKRSFFWLHTIKWMLWANSFVPWTNVCLQVLAIENSLKLFSKVVCKLYKFRCSISNSANKDEQKAAACQSAALQWSRKAGGALLFNATTQLLQTPCLCCLWAAPPPPTETSQPTVSNVRVCSLCFHYTSSKG